VAFAKDFAVGRGNDPGSQFNILAVDWHDGGRPLGSDPNGLDLPADIAGDAVKDAQQSALNGIHAAVPLADKLFTAGAQPESLFLIGHSNGAGFMASLAAELSRKTNGRKVAELDALDAPWL